MADVKPKSATSPKVSPARTVASLILLLVVGVVCAIELRAGFGQMMSGKSLAAKSNDGEFTDLSLEEARGMMSLAPESEYGRWRNSMPAAHRKAQRSPAAAGGC